MTMYTLAVFPPGEARTQVLNTMANHNVTFFSSPDPNTLLPFLKNPGFKKAGSPENPPPKKFGDQANSFVDRCRPSFGLDALLKTNGCGNSDVQVTSLPDTVEAPHPIPSFSRQQHFDDSVIQGPASKKKPAPLKMSLPKKESSLQKKATAKEKSFSCDVCKKVLSSRHSLENHLLIHSGEKPFECDVCQKRHRTKMHLKLHIRTHTGLKPFECDVCKERFAAKCTLDRHVRTHTGEKPFECEDCEKKFADKHNLKSHRTRYHF